MKKVIKNRTFPEERALYHLQNTSVMKCVFEGEADGESALKEAVDIDVDSCTFALRYPLWHTKRFSMKNSVMKESCRAPIWYANNGTITDCVINGVKAVRECNNIALSKCEISSIEFGWKSRDISLNESSIVAEYLFLDGKNITLKKVNMKGKYSFQYNDGLTIEDSVLDTKDAFWHSKNITVKNSIIKGEYLAWFSENLTLINCKIIGTQPFCYCKKLKLINCTMEGCDLSFEYSDVNAEINGRIDSVKNPKSGIIVADEIGETVMEDAVMECTGKVKIRDEISSPFCINSCELINCQLRAQTKNLEFPQQVLSSSMYD